MQQADCILELIARHGQHHVHSAALCAGGRFSLKHPMHGSFTSGESNPSGRAPPCWELRGRIILLNACMRLLTCIVHMPTHRRSHACMLACLRIETGAHYTHKSKMELERVNNASCTPQPAGLCRRLVSALNALMGLEMKVGRYAGRLVSVPGSAAHPRSAAAMAAMST